MSEFNPDDHPHTRYNPLKDEWILVSPHRTKRPWMGKVEEVKHEPIKRFDPKNPLCPGVTRPNGTTNPNYESTFVFDNDFPALFDYELANEDQKTQACSNEIESDLFKIKPAKGSCKVMCFHPFSDLTLPTMKLEEIVQVIQTWIKMFKELKPKYEWVQIFENKGDIMGCSNPHPHCQVWASDFLPNDIKTEHRTQKEFYEKHKKIMLVEYLKRELDLKTRVVLENEHWAVLIPFWAVWPYETILLPKRHILRFDDLADEEITSLADAMKRLLIKYDNLFKCSFPYSMGFHFAPSGSHLSEDCTHWQFHAEYLPPLLRSATVKKFMVGYELMAQAQRDLTAEMAAKTLRELSDTIHYTQTN